MSAFTQDPLILCPAGLVYQHACQVSISQPWDSCPGASIIWYLVAEGLSTAAYSRRLLGTSQPASTPNRTGLARPYA